VLLIGSSTQFKCLLWHMLGIINVPVASAAQVQFSRVLYIESQHDKDLTRFDSVKSVGHGRFQSFRSPGIAEAIACYSNDMDPLRLHAARMTHASQAGRRGRPDKAGHALLGQDTSAHRSLGAKHKGQQGWLRVIYW
jgi:hypothetical protein